MSWHYAARKTESYEFDVSEEVYELVIVYDYNGVSSHTLNAVTVFGSSREDLAKWLRQAADDVMKYDVIDRIEQPH